ncbi:hypothetical protein GJ744_007717 [Endocarpon pusillum]|uniref:Uncharacterized protein n=1 Tax=Endocarpon pusillum TaxID=364733 RepID=A0A8H7AVB2_9EURO|nr:hypothetical protein GJ744_007717 [Endocarpon pusillum]
MGPDHQQHSRAPAPDVDQRIITTKIRRHRAGTGRDVFVDSARIIGNTGFHGTPFTSEDLHRAFQVLKFDIRHRSTAKNENSFYHSTADAPAKPTQYFTPEDLVAARSTTGEIPDDTKAKTSHVSLFACDKPSCDKTYTAADAVHPMEQLARVEEELPDPEGIPDRIFDTEEHKLDAGADMLKGVIT